MIYMVQGLAKMLTFSAAFLFPRNLLIFAFTCVYSL